MTIEETLYGHSLSIRNDTLKRDGKQRIFERFLFRARAILFLNNGARVTGITDNVSFLGVMLQPDNPGDDGFLDLNGILKVGLDEDQEIESCFVAFNCQVIWINEQGIGLQLMPSKSPGLHHDPAQAGSRVSVKRSDGRFDSGWTVLQHSAPLPEFVIERIKRIENQGPVAVCYKEHGGQGGFYKVMTVQNLYHVQKMARITKHA